jgi:Holliday junction resolvase
MATSLEKNFWSVVKNAMERDLPGVHLQRIETGMTGRGIPDVNACYRGVEAWLELKVVEGRRVLLRPEQVAWHAKRAAVGGNNFIIARDKRDGVRVGKFDRLYVWHGSQAVSLVQQGLDCPPLYVGDRPWSWPEVHKLFKFF